MDRPALRLKTKAQSSDNDSLRRRLIDMVFGLTYESSCRGLNMPADCAVDSHGAVDPWAEFRNGRLSAAIEAAQPRISRGLGIPRVSRPGSDAPPLD